MAPGVGWAGGFHLRRALTLGVLLLAPLVLAGLPNPSGSNVATAGFDAGSSTVLQGPLDVAVTYDLTFTNMTGGFQQAQLHRPDDSNFGNVVTPYSDGAHAGKVNLTFASVRLDVAGNWSVVTDVGGRTPFPVGQANFTFASFSPTAGDPGTVVNLTGSGLLNVTNATLGGVSVAITAVNDSLAQLTVPSITWGSYVIVLANAGGRATQCCFVVPHHHPDLDLLSVTILSQDPLHGWETRTLHAIVKNVGDGPATGDFAVLYVSPDRPAVQALASSSTLADFGYFASLGVNQTTAVDLHWDTHNDLGSYRVRFGVSTVDEVDLANNALTQPDYVYADIGVGK
jgi:hypothetical protein